jgi:hypothetical protein
MRVLLALLVAASFAVACSTAQAASSIEGRWSYSGGEVLVRSTGTDTYTGTVVREVNTSPCRHPAGEVIWAINDTGEPDLYRGGQTFRDAADCAIAPDRGFARWVVDGDRAELCLVPPDDVARRPECERITRRGGQRSTPSFASTVVLPSTKRCRRDRSLRIRIRQPRGDAIVSALVHVNGKRVKSVPRSELDRPIVLRRLPKRRYRVRVTLQTATERTIRGTRTYRTCASR